MVNLSVALVNNDQYIVYNYVDHYSPRLQKCSCNSTYAIVVSISLHIGRGGPYIYKRVPNLMLEWGPHSNMTTVTWGSHFHMHRYRIKHVSPSAVLQGRFTVSAASLTTRHSSRCIMRAMNTELNSTSFTSTDRAYGTTQREREHHTWPAGRGMQNRSTVKLTP